MEDQKCKLSPTTLIILILGIIYILSISPANAAMAVADTRSSLSTYIIQVRKPTDKHFATVEDLDSLYRSFLPTTAASSNQEQRMVHSYQHALSGFAAKLTAEEAKAVQEKDGVLQVHPEEVLSLHTTRTPDFLGLHQGVGFWKDSNFGKGVIIGLLDSGVFPEHPSFNDEGVPPPPAKWKGRCDFNGTSCNNKLIGARSFINPINATQAVPPYDDTGHGTHTSSTAAGAFVRDASALGNAKGTAVGMAPLAHLAMYKVCVDDGCPASSILAGFDAAIEDGVDVLSVSLGGNSKPFFKDWIAQGAFAATQKGIFVSCSAGNSGPYNTSLSNEAPWILTVGASSIDRSIEATARLGNGLEFDGETLYQPHNFHPALLPLIYPEIDDRIQDCGKGSLRFRSDIRGKVVVCDLGSTEPVVAGQEVKDRGGVAMILVNGPTDGYTTLADAHVLPAVEVSYVAGREIKRYFNTASTPMATILFKGTHIIRRSVAPAVASFSSRGPNRQSPGILKPDIIGPGLNILAGWPFPLDNSTNLFNVISGTSMSCPHLSGVAALLKSTHPNWSPEAIKSAIMTTSTTFNMEGRPIVDETLHPADIFATGAGHINPSKAVDPGLVYDDGPQDYIPYLCGLISNESQIEVIVKKKVNCSSIGSIPDYQLNYPSITVSFKPSVTNVSVTRTVKNVGPAKSRYQSVVDPIKGPVSLVYPRELVFTEANQTASYRVDFTREVDSKAPSPYAQGAITWVSARHSVRTPIAIVFE
ncbi:LOW QUALITY PROTEIN: subtilisin-like protease 1 [Eucalyptus grandis]|uniref:LOW QUALITY PROTEIN: subtilisin-like protease 1 n=1 Tax=Eucalyptus grandis TaxID=71139 RepID=UPI00192EDF48|nr:LOW QUALITY PROTEIN: subtilisin-like protease 1 [Eucalyptus grandis]